MKFASKREFNSYLDNLRIIGCGENGASYLDNEHNIVLKVYHDYEIDDKMSHIYSGYEHNLSYLFDGEAEEEIKPRVTKEDILKFSAIENDTFIWPKDIIEVNGEIAGYYYPYIIGVNLSSITTHDFQFKKLIEAITSSIDDIKRITASKVRITKLENNILYQNKLNKLKVVGTSNYKFDQEVTLEENLAVFEKELKTVLVTKRAYHINDNALLKILYDIYDNKQKSVKDFIEIMQKELERVLEIREFPRTLKDVDDLTLKYHILKRSRKK